jgi:hypothetical protein
MDEQVRKLALLILLAVLSAAAPAGAAVVGSYTLTLPPGSGVVMGDSLGNLSFTLTNTTASGGASIGYLKLSFDATYYNVSEAVTAPPGWRVSEVKNAGAGQTYIVFSAVGSGLAPGASAVFTAIIKGLNNGLIPSAPANVTEALSGAEVSINGGKDVFSGSASSWTRYGLYARLVASPSTLGAGEALAVSMEVVNRTTGTQTISPSALTEVGSGGVSWVSGPSPSSATLAAGGAQYFNFSYTATAAGTVTFSGHAANGGSTVTSPVTVSNPVVIGSFTALLDITPIALVSSQQVRVILTVTNNSGGNLSGISPSLTPGGTATLTRVSGPTPAAVGLLRPGTSTILTWYYTVTGAVGATYSFTGSASSSTLATNTAASQVGRITGYGATIVPDFVGSGATNASFVYTVFNQGALPVRRIRIYTTTGWTYASASGPTGWTLSTGGTPLKVTFTASAAGYYIPTGGSASFSVTYASVPTVPAPTVNTFVIGVWDSATALADPATGAAEVSVDITPYAISLSRSIPAGFADPPVADGSQYYDVVAAVTGPGGPLSGAQVDFTTTFGTLASPASVTDGAGRAFETLTGTLSLSPATATLTASCRGAIATTRLAFSAYPGLALDYLPGTLSPITVTAGQTGVVFSLRVVNTGAATTTLAAGSFFRFADSTAGGTSSFTASLASASPASIATGASSLLTFASGDVAASFLGGTYPPLLWLTDGITPGGARPVSDGVTVSVPSTAVRVIRWREQLR